MRRHKNLIIGAIALLAVLVIGGFFVWGAFMEKPEYTAVYLRTGDLYFGELVRFPHYGLKQPYLLQFNKDNQQNPFSLQSFKDAIWGPEDFISLNRDEVVWTASLRSDSNLAKLFASNPNLAPSQGTSNAQGGANQGLPPAQLPPQATSTQGR